MSMWSLIITPIYAQAVSACQLMSLFSTMKAHSLTVGVAAAPTLVAPSPMATVMVTVMATIMVAVMAVKPFGG